MNGWVPLTDAARAAHRPTRTVRAWVALGHVRAYCTVKDHRLMVWLPDVYDRTFTAARRLRHTA